MILVLFVKMAKMVTNISKVAIGRIDWRLQARVICLWFIPDIKIMPT